MSKQQQVLTSNLQTNIHLIDQWLGQSADIVKREFTIQGKHGLCLCMDGLSDTVEIRSILETMLHRHSSSHSAIENMKDLYTQLLSSRSATLGISVEEAVQGILQGNTLLLLEGNDRYLLVATPGWNARSIEEPATENVVRGPRDGFTENLGSNAAAVRRRIKDPNLRFHAMEVGAKTKTKIYIAYIQGTVKEGLVEEIKSRIEKIQIDGVLESGYIEEMISDTPTSPFTTIQSTERPDKVAASLLEGRAAVMVDTTPFALVMPAFFWQFFQASDDYYSSYWVASFFRVVRYLAFIISLTLPSLYVMVVSFHQEMIPTGLALTIASGREIVAFPVLMEALIMELAFELMREAGLRMPKPVGQAVSIVGSLIIGQAAVQAGVVSPFMVIIVATTGIASFAIPNYAASFSIRLIRFPLLLASGYLGLLGFSALLYLVIIHALSLRSFGESYLAPASPFRPSDYKDLVIRMPWWKMITRPNFAAGPTQRQATGQMPKPPQKNEAFQEEDSR